MRVRIGAHGVVGIGEVDQRRAGAFGGIKQCLWVLMVVVVGGEF